MTTWSEFPVLPEAPPHAPHGTPVLTGERRYTELEPTGINALIAWCCGPEHPLRCLDDTPPGRTRVTEIRDGQTRVRFEERTRAEQAGIEADIDAYLEDAGIPGQPFGYRWFVELPAGLADGHRLLDTIQERMSQEVQGPELPAAVLPVVARTCERLYRGQ